MTAAEFEERYASNSGFTVEKGYELGLFPAVPCDCGDESCRGWRRRYEDDALGENPPCGVCGYHKGRHSESCEAQ